MNVKGRGQLNRIACIAKPLEATGIRRIRSPTSHTGQIQHAILGIGSSSMCTRAVLAG